METIRGTGRCLVTLGLLLPVALAHGNRNEPTSIHRSDDLEEADRLHDEGAEVVARAMDGPVPPSALLEAQASLERALEIRLRQLPGEDQRIGNTLHELGNLKLLLDEPEEAHIILRRALTIREQAETPSELDIARTVNFLAGTYMARFLYADAIPLYERAFPVFEEHLGPDHYRTLQMLNNLCVALVDQRQFEEADAGYRRVIDSFERTFGPDDIETIKVLFNRGVNLHRMQRFIEAREVFARTLAFYERTSGPESQETARSLSRLGEISLALGKYEEARTLFERAIMIYEQAGEDFILGGMWNTLGIAYVKLKDYAAAQDCYNEALRVRVETLGEDHFFAGSTRANIGALRLATGRLEEAAQLLEEFGTPELKASLYAKLGQYDKARASLEQAVALSTDLPSTTADLFANELLAEVRWNLGDKEGAWRVLKKGPARHVWFQELTATLGESESFALRATLLSELELQLSLAEAMSAAEQREAYDALVAWKGEVLRLSRSRRGSDLTPERSALLEELRDITTQLSNLVHAHDEAEGWEAERIELLRVRYSELELQWNQSVGKTAVATTGFERVRDALPEGSVLLDFFVHRAYRPARFEGERVAELGSWSQPHLGVWIVRPEGDAPERVDLGPAADFDRDVRKFVDYLRAVRSLPMRGSVVPASSQEDVSKALREKLWTPLEKRVGKAKRVFVSPDGAVASLPFEVLSSGKDRFLIEDFTFSYLQDATRLLDSPTSPSYESLLSVGAVDYDTRGKRALSKDVVEQARQGSRLRARVDQKWRFLPNTEPEARSVHRLHEESFEDGHRLLLKDAGATEERLKRELGGFHVVHLATHGFWLPELPSLWSRAMDLARPDGLPPRLRAVPAGISPGLLSGVVCAGANLDQDANQEDGLLTADEVAWLDLTSIELVVLSACSSAVGLEQSGEGLLGLRRAFESAGVKTVVSTLWEIPDDATRRLMDRFYENLWSHRLSRLEALRRAQLATLEQNRKEHGDALPGTWGAFVLTGDWR